MKKVTLKATTEDTFRGTGLGSMDWSLSSKLHSTAKKIASTFNDEPKQNFNKAKTPNNKKIKIACSVCGKHFKTQGKLPSHQISKQISTIDKNDKQIFINEFSKCIGIPVIEGKLKLTEYKIKELLVNIGDTIIYETYNVKLPIGQRKELFEKTIKEIIQTNTLGNWKDYKSSIVIEFTDNTQIDYFYDICIINKK